MTSLLQYLGDSVTHTVPLLWRGLSFEPGNAWGLIWTAKEKTSDPDSAAVIQKASGLGLSVTGSVASIALVPQDSAELAAIVLVWDIQAQHLTTGEVRTVAFGRLELARDVTRETTTSIPVQTTEPPYPGGGDPAVAIHAADAKPEIADDDEFGLSDSADSWSLKKASWSAIKARLKAYFDPLYQAAGVTWSTLSGKPATFAPSAHKSSHATGGADALTPADIGAQPAGSYAPASGIAPSAIAGTAVIANQLSTTGGANKVPQLDASGNLTTGLFSNPANATPGNGVGNVFLPDKQVLEWLRQDGTKSGQRIWGWDDHGGSPGTPELILESPDRIALIARGGIQVGPNDPGRYIRYLQLVSGYPGATPALNLMPSGSMIFQTRAWTGTGSGVENSIIAQAHPLDNSGSNSVLRIWDQASINQAGDTLTPSRNNAAGNLIAEIYKDGIWSRGTAPTFQILPDGATINYACSKFKSSQNAEVVLAGNRTLVLSGVEDGMRGVIFVTQDGAGNRTLTPSGGSALDLSTAPNACDRVAWEYDGLLLIFSVAKNVQRELLALDADAAAFIAAASLTNVTQKVAVNNLVTSLKSASLWAKFYGIYPFVGGNSAAHAQDLKAAYDITWAGTLTHNANGVTGDGATGYGNTGINLSTLSATNSASAYIYCKSQTVNAGAYFCGATAAGGGRFGMSENAGLMIMQGVNDGTAGTNFSADGDFRRHWAVNRSGSNAKQLYRNAAAAVASDASTSAPNHNVFVFARNAAGSPSGYINANFAFAAIGQSLSSAEWATFQGIVNTFQTTLGRANP